MSSCGEIRRAPRVDPAIFAPVGADGRPARSTLDESMRSPSWRNADIQQMLKFWGLPSRPPGGGRRDRQTILAFWDEQVVIMLHTFLLIFVLL